MCSVLITNAQKSYLSFSNVHHTPPGVVCTEVYSYSLALHGLRVISLEYFWRQSNDSLFLRIQSSFSCVKIKVFLRVTCFLWHKGVNHKA